MYTSDADKCERRVGEDRKRKEERRRDADKSEKRELMRSSIPSDAEKRRSKGNAVQCSVIEYIVIVQHYIVI